MAHTDFKDQARRTVCSKVLFDKAFEIASNSFRNMMDINLDCHQWSKIFLIRRLEILLLSQ